MLTTVEMAPAQPSRRMQVLIWMLRALMVAVFVPAGVMKLAGTSSALSEFQLIGFGTWFRYFAGIVELAGGALATIPSLSVFGVLILLAVVIGALLVILTYLQRRQIVSRLGKS